MGGLFSKEKISNNSNSNVNQNSKVTDKDKAVLDLKNARDRLKKYRKKVEKDSEQLTEQAKVFIEKQQKDRALIILKLRRLRENEVNKIDSELMSILEMINNIEWEHANMEVIKALKVGNAALNKLHQEMSINDVIDMLEEVNDEIEVENKINQVLSSQFDIIIDNNELEKELEELMNGNVTIDTKDSIDSDKFQLPIVPNSSINIIKIPIDIHINEKEDLKINNQQPILN